MGTAGNGYDEEEPMEPYKVIEYPSVGATYHHDDYGVYQYSEYEESSVLAGQTKRSFLGSYKTLAAAKAEHPDAQWDGEDNTGYQEVHIPEEAPDWFHPDDAGEVWNERDAY